MSMWLQPCGCVTEDNTPVVTCPLHDAADEIDTERWEGEGGRVTKDSHPHLYALLMEAMPRDPKPFVLPDLIDRVSILGHSGDGLPDE